MKLKLNKDKKLRCWTDQILKTIIRIEIKTKTKNVKRSLDLAGWKLREADLTSRRRLAYSLK